MSGNTVLCPSSTCSEGAILLGVIQSDGQLAYINDKLIIDDKFVETAHEGRQPEKRFRFANKCVKSGCRQWTGSECGVINRVAALDVDLPVHEQLPDCSIRENCRWFGQIGSRACGVCPYVITDSRPE